MNAVIDIFSLLTAAAGWYYMFYSRAAQKLEHIEAQRTNTTRVRLRRVGGLVMMLLGILFFAGFQERIASHPGAFVGIWMGVLLLLATIVVLAMVDVRLTYKLREQRRRRREQSDS